MATKIGYVQREPTEQINWAEVGSNFSSILSEEARVREEKKAEIDRATREQQRVLDDAVTGDSANMNDWSLDFASEAQNQLLMTNSLLKNGQLKPKDYTIIRQNLADGTDQAMTLAQEYQNEYSEKMARAKANPGSNIGPDGKPIVGAQALEEFLMGTVEGFGNFSKSKLVINPQSGNVSVGFINDKGELESDPNKLVGINTLRNRIKDKIDAYDIDSAIIKVKDGQLGVVSQVINKMGGLYEKGFVQTTTGVQIANETTRAKMVADGTMTQEESDVLGQYAKTEDSWVESQLSNQYNITSLLTNNLGGIAPNGETYTFTYNPSEENENTILLRNEGNKAVPDFTSAQGKLHRETAKEGLKTRLRGSLDIKTEVKTVSGTQYRPDPPTPEYVLDRGDAEEQKISVLSSWRAVATEPDLEKKKVLLNALIGADGTNKNITGFDFIKTDIIDGKQNYDLIIRNATEGDLIIPIPANADVGTWDLAGASVHGVGTKEEAAKLVTYDAQGNPLNLNFDGINIGRKRGNDSYEKSFNTKASGTELFAYDKSSGDNVAGIDFNVFDTKLAKQVNDNPTLKDLGVTAVADGKRTLNYVTFSMKGSKPLRLPANQLTKNGGQDQQKALMNWIKQGIKAMSPQDRVTLFKKNPWLKADQADNNGL